RPHCRKSSSGAGSFAQRRPHGASVGAGLGPPTQSPDGPGSSLGSMTEGDRQDPSGEEPGTSVNIWIEPSAPESRFAWRRQDWQGPGSIHFIHALILFHTPTIPAALWAVGTFRPERDIGLIRDTHLEAEISKRVCLVPAPLARLRLEF